MVSERDFDNLTCVWSSNVYALKGLPWNVTYVWSTEMRFWLTFEALRWDLLLFSFIICVCLPVVKAKSNSRRWEEYMLLIQVSLCYILGGGGGVTCICHDTVMCHYFGYFVGVLPDFWVPFRDIPGFLGINFLVKFDFFKNNPDFWVLILIFY